MLVGRLDNTILHIICLSNVFFNIRVCVCIIVYLNLSICSYSRVLNWFLSFAHLMFAGVADIDIEQIDRKKTDPEYLVYECLDVEAVEKLLNETVEQLSNIIKVTPSLAKVLLLEHKWKISEIVEKYRVNANGLMVNKTKMFSDKKYFINWFIIQIRARIKPPHSSRSSMKKLDDHGSMSSSASSSSTSSASSCGGSCEQMCSVCATGQPGDKYFNLSCAHSFCKDCWSMHFETQINQGISTAMGCMASKCNVRVPEELVLNLLTKPLVRDKYQQFAFLDYVKSHPELRFCPGPNCQVS